MGFVRVLFAVVLVAGIGGPAAAFEFEPLDPGSEISFANAAPPGARSRAAQTSLPVLRGGTVRGRLTVQGMYERKGERVYFETRRGEPAKDRSVAADHPFEIDICFRDKDGLPLFASIAGDEPLIEDCTPDRVVETLTQRPDLLDGQNRSFVQMKKAARTIKKAAFVATFAAEKKELVEPAIAAARHVKLKRPMETLLPNVVFTGPSPTPLPYTPTPDDASSSSASYGDSSAASPRRAVYWKHMMGVHTGRAFNITPFEHTATLAYTAYSFDRRFSWALFAWENRNHGRHWYDAGMRHKCSYHSSFDRSPSIWNQRCSTPYNPTSFYGHNCNDDAVLQIWSVKFNRPYNNRSGYPCNDPYFNLYTPMCFPNG
jgi:hypothetical protein